MDLFGVDRLRNFQLWGLPTLDQIQDQRGGPNFHRCGPTRHVGIAGSHKPRCARVHMRPHRRVDQGTTIQRVDAHHHAEKSARCGNLIDSRIPLAALAFNPHFPRRKNLASERNGRTPATMRSTDIAAHQVIVVATVAVAGKIGLFL